MSREQVRIAREFWREMGNIARLGREMWRLIPRARKLALGGALLVMSVASAANTAIPLCLGRLVDAVNPDSNRRLSPSGLFRIAAMYLAFIGVAYVVRETFNVLRRYLVENTCTRIDRDMFVRVIGHVLKVELSALAHEQVGSLHSRITRSVSGLVMFLRMSFLDFIPALMTGGFALAAALSKEPRIALAMAGVVPLSVALTMWQLVTQKGVRLGLMRSCEAMDGTVVEQLNGLDYVRAANTHRQEVRRVEMVAERRRGVEIRHHFEMSLFGSGKALNEGFFHLLVVATAIYFFVHGGIRYGDILTFSVLYMNVMAPLNEIHRFIDVAHESSLKVGDLVEILAVPIDRSFTPADPREPHIAVGAPLFTAEDLRAEYRTADGKVKRGLDGVSLAIRHGETIGIAGRSGGGKSTWVRVLMRLTHPSGGSATLGGVPLESITRDAIGDYIGYVGQNPFLFAGTIAENITYGNGDASREQVVHSAWMACIHDEIMRMPDGYESRVAERGQNLSGGQRQRIALARVFLKNPPVLILDEGTSALDNISERSIQRAINAARADRTVILVAHRLTTLLDADRIFVFDEGRVVETGTYDELVHMKGVFAELVRSANADPDSMKTPAAAAHGAHEDHYGKLPIEGELQSI